MCWGCNNITPPSPRPTCLPACPPYHPPLPPPIPPPLPVYLTACRHITTAQGEPVQIRIGIHTGPVVGGVMGTKTPRFSIYGDTVNM